MNKKISLKNLNLKEVEQLSRKQLRDVLGGFIGGTGVTGTDGVTGTEPMQICYCGPNASCAVIGFASKTCTQICEGFEDCDD